MKITRNDLRNLIRESLDEVGLTPKPLALGGVPGSGQTGKSLTDYDIEHLQDVLAILKSKMQSTSMLNAARLELQTAADHVEKALRVVKMAKK